LAEAPKLKDGPLLWDWDPKPNEKGEGEAGADVLFSRVDTMPVDAGALDCLSAGCPKVNPTEGATGVAFTSGTTELLDSVPRFGLVNGEDVDAGMALLGAEVAKVDAVVSPCSSAASLDGACPNKDKLCVASAGLGAPKEKTGLVVEADTAEENVWEVSGFSRDCTDVVGMKPLIPTEGSGALAPSVTGRDRVLDCTGNRLLTCVPLTPKRDVAVEETGFSYDWLTWFVEVVGASNPMGGTLTFSGTLNAVELAKKLGTVAAGAGLGSRCCEGTDSWGAGTSRCSKLKGMGTADVAPEVAEAEVKVGVLAYAGEASLLNREVPDVLVLDGRGGMPERENGSDGTGGSLALLESWRIWGASGFENENPGGMLNAGAFFVISSFILLSSSSPSSSYVAEKMLLFLGILTEDTWCREDLALPTLKEDGWSPSSNRGGVNSSETGGGRGCSTVW
jgi:hypothetical protein